MTAGHNSASPGSVPHKMPKRLEQDRCLMDLFERSTYNPNYFTTDLFPQGFSDEPTPTHRPARPASLDQLPPPSAEQICAAEMILARLHNIRSAAPQLPPISSQCILGENFATTAGSPDGCRNCHVCGARREDQQPWVSSTPALLSPPPPSSPTSPSSQRVPTHSTGPLAPVPGPTGSVPGPLQGVLGGQTHGPPGANVFVFHIPNEWTDMELVRRFSPFGTLVSAKIATDKNNGRRLGFGFVSFAELVSAGTAVRAMNGVAVNGKRLKVTIKRGEEQYAFLLPKNDGEAQSRLLFERQLRSMLRDGPRPGSGKNAGTDFSTPGTVATSTGGSSSRGRSNSSCVGWSGSD